MLYDYIITHFKKVSALYRKTIKNDDGIFIYSIITF